MVEFFYGGIRVMNWTILSRIADILSVISFFISIGIFQKIYSRSTFQKETYTVERTDLLEALLAIRENIWNDGLISDKIQDTLQTKVFEYQMKYLLISSPRCIFHTFRCTCLLKIGINDSNINKIRQDINFLIARLSKKE